MSHRSVLKHLGRLGLAAVTLAGPPLYADDSSEARARWHQAIGARYTLLAEAGSQLEASAQAYCDAPDAEARTRLEDDWLEAYQAWQGVRFVDFGPIEQQSRAWQLQFWPDNKNLVGRKVQAWLNTDAPSTIEAIAADSVAVQGFPALEYLLFDEHMAPPRALATPRACGLLQAVSGHLADTGAALVRDWRAFGEHYRGTDSYTAATLQAGLLTLETLEDKRLAEPLGLAGSVANGYRAEAWRSERSVRLIEASLSGLQDSFLPGLRPLLAEAGQPGLANDFATALDEARQRAATMAPGLAPALDDTAAFAELQGLYVEISQLSWLGQRIAGALGLVRGFNASDGD
ncbi:Imelysin [Halomonas sp. THAF12]|uniref:imelysin family protein n=1 Tax=Halomonas sp. THAF12 TaxID=2587849 RepID=UPI0012694641|nr:imelysin family protein [Halomonas sp. THAF12]QFT84857.1 Imelysin [Halomonas sp. THAF12]